MATECKIIINFVLDDALVCYNLHVVIIVALFLQHVIELELRCVPLFSHLDESVNLAHIGKLLQIFLFYLLHFWFGDHSPILQDFSFFLSFRGRLNLFFTLFALHLINEVHHLSGIPQCPIHWALDHFCINTKLLVLFIICLDLSL